MGAPFQNNHLGRAARKDEDVKYTCLQYIKGRRGIRNGPETGEEEDIY